jgi:hypothetical protein
VLTDTQKTNVRRFGGWGLVGDTATAIYAQPVYAPSYIRTGVGLLLSDRLNHLTPSEESVLIEVYLEPLEKLETDILSVADNVDTDSAGPWVHNKRERQDRESLFNSLRRRMCSFLNFLPGPYLSGSDYAMAVVRA